MDTPVLVPIDTQYTAKNTASIITVNNDVEMSIVCHTDNGLFIVAKQVPPKLTKWHMNQSFLTIMRILCTPLSLARALVACVLLKI